MRITKIFGWGVRNLLFLMLEKLGNTADEIRGFRRFRNYRIQHFAGFDLLYTTETFRDRFQEISAKFEAGFLEYRKMRTVVCELADRKSLFCAAVRVPTHLIMIPNADPRQMEAILRVHLLVRKAWTTTRGLKGAFSWATADRIYNSAEYAAITDPAPEVRFRT